MKKHLKMHVYYVKTQYLKKNEIIQLVKYYRDKFKFK